MENNSSSQLLPQQVVIGAANSYSSAFSYTRFLGRDLLAYASDNSVIIYSETTFAQILGGHTSEVTCVAWCDSIGKLVTCSKEKIVFFEPEDEELDPSKVAPSIKMHWNKTQEIDARGSDITSASWNQIGTRLLLAGKDNMLIEFDVQEKKWKQIWKVRNPNPVYQILFSPDERIFATLSKNDRIVKIWFRTSITEQEETFSSLYLPHPKSVNFIDWRPKNKDEV